MSHARPYYLGIFLTERSIAAVRGITRDCRGTDATPSGCKVAGDHVTCVFAPTSEEIAAFPLDAYRGARIALPATVAASGECWDDAQAFVVGVDFDEAMYQFGLRCAAATPHVSVFIAENVSWSVCGDVLARALANGSALELNAIGAERVLEGTLGIMMQDTRDASARWVATSMDEVRAATRVDPYGRHIKMDDLRASSDDDDDSSYDDSSYDDSSYDDEDDDEYVDAPSSSLSASYESTPVIKLGFRYAGTTATSRNYGSGIGVGAHFKSDGPAIRGRPAIECAVRQWTKLQGDCASSMLAARRAANIVVKQSWVENLNEDVKKLRLRQKKGGNSDPELEKRIRDKLSKRVALERMAMSRDLPRFDDDSMFDLVIDFHGYSRRDAVQKLERELIRVGSLVTSEWAMKLITGRGIHSSGGPVVHKDIKAWLDQFGLAYEENPDAGHIVVRATAPVFGTKMRP